jgi:predicted membrane protein
MAKEGANNTNSSGVFAVIMAILSILLPISALPFGFVAGIPCALLGLIFGIVQVRKANNSWAVWAIVLSIIGLIVNTAIVIIILAAINEVSTQYQSLQQTGLIDNVKNAADLAQQYGELPNVQ